MGTPVPVGGAQASDLAQVTVLPVLVPSWRLLNQTGSATSAIAQDGPSSERGRDTYPDELYRQTDELRR